MKFGKHEIRINFFLKLDFALPIYFLKQEKTEKGIKEKGESERAKLFMFSILKTYLRKNFSA